MTSTESGFDGAAFGIGFCTTTIKLDLHQQLHLASESLHPKKFSSKWQLLPSFLSICTPHLLISKKLLTICCCCQEKDKLAVVLPPLAEEVALTKNAALQVLQA